MIKHICDCCRTEITIGKKEFKPYVHIRETAEGRTGYAVVTDRQRDSMGHSTSGRQLHYDLCAGCYNEVYGAAWAKFTEMKKRAGHEEDTDG